jgi:hypothetical protein
MYALIFLGLCYAALTLKIYGLRNTGLIDYTLTQQLALSVWLFASAFVFVGFVLFLGAIK